MARGLVRFGTVLAVLLALLTSTVAPTTAAPVAQGEDGVAIPDLAEETTLPQRATFKLVAEAGEAVSAALTMIEGNPAVAFEEGEVVIETLDINNPLDRAEFRVAQLNTRIMLGVAQELVEIASGALENLDRVLEEEIGTELAAVRTAGDSLDLVENQELQEAISVALDLATAECGDLASLLQTTRRDLRRSLPFFQLTAAEIQDGESNLAVSLRAMQALRTDLANLEESLACLADLRPTVRPEGLTQVEQAFLAQLPGQDGGELEEVLLEDLEAGEEEATPLDALEQTDELLEGTTAEGDLLDPLQETVELLEEPAEDEFPDELGGEEGNLLDQLQETDDLLEEPAEEDAPLDEFLPEETLDEFDQEEGIQIDAVEVTDILANPSLFADEEVVVIGEAVDTGFGPHLFTLAEAGVADVDGTLFEIGVLVPTGLARTLEIGEDLLVAGAVRQFDREQLEQEFNLTLDNSLAAALEGRPVIVAVSVRALR